jgi:hypothetical protein
MAGHIDTTPSVRTLQEAKARSALIWHTVVFTIANTLMWVQDLVAGGGLDYAYWATIPWGFGLGIHAIAYAIERRRPAEHHYGEVISPERMRELQSH